jgi:CRP-like cAMP-binding protein
MDDMLSKTKNALLKAISLAARAKFAPAMQRVTLTKGEVLQEPGQPVEWVFFPEKGLISVVAETQAGEAVESANIGQEGALGVFEACGSRMSFSRAVVQIPGAAWRMRAQSYRDMFGACADLRTEVHKYVELLLAQARQFVLCNAIHPVERRLSRFLLDALDQSGVDGQLPFTQETLAQVLGVQRTTVAACASVLQRAGLIRSGRGAIEVLDREGLERTACSCRPTLGYIRSELAASALDACEA